jgi:prepilin-type N-terminal cleavage/methylation domain-containing protein
MTSRARQGCRGVSLIELIIVIVAVSIGVAALGTAYLTSAKSVTLNEDIQIAWQDAQSCAEFILGSVRRPGSFASVPAASPSPVCTAAAVPLNAASTRVVSVAALAAGTEPCALASWSCRMVNVSVTRSGYTASVNFMIVDN